MPHCFISESSRRPQQVGEEVVEKNWPARPAKIVCSKCGLPSYNGRYFNGRCPGCYAGERAARRVSDPRIQIK